MGIQIGKILFSAKHFDLSVPICVELFIKSDFIIYDFYCNLKKNFARIRQFLTKLYFEEENAPRACLGLSVAPGATTMTQFWLSLALALWSGPT